jgi:hypothetical protein
VVLAIVMSSSSKDDAPVAAGPSPSLDVSEPTSDAATTTEDVTVPESETTTTTSAVDSADRPNAGGWFAVVSSGLKSDPAVRGQVERAAGSVAGAVVIDTDDYYTLPRATAGKPPDYFPAANALAAAVGPFSSLEETQAWCGQNRPGEPCNPRQLAQP